MRLHAKNATIENGFVYLPREAHWLADYLHELTIYPAGCHDDQVDSMSQALAWTKQRTSAWGWIEYYRDLAERANGTAPPSEVRLKTPPGVTHVYGMNGQLYAVREEFVTVAEENTPPLLRAGFTHG